MNAGLCLVYEDRIHVREWRLIFSNFSITDRYLLSPGIVPEQAQRLFKAQVIDGLDELPEGRPRVVLSPHNSKVPGVVNLCHFEHPEDAIYVFGSNNHAPHEGLRDNDLTVHIPVVGEMMNHHAAACVLWDRHLKGAVNL